MTDKQIFFLITLWFVSAVLIMFAPTGEGGEWVFIDYFHALVTVPVSGWWFWHYYKKI